MCNLARSGAPRQPVAEFGAAVGVLDRQSVCFVGPLPQLRIEQFVHARQGTVKWRAAFEAGLHEQDGEGAAGADPQCEPCGIGRPQVGHQRTQTGLFVDRIEGMLRRPLQQVGVNQLCLRAGFVQLGRGGFDCAGSEVHGGDGVAG